MHISLHGSTRRLVYAGLQWPLNCGCGCAKAFAIFAEAHLVPSCLGMAHSRSHVALSCGVFKRGLPNALVLADADSGGPTASQD